MPGRTQQASRAIDTMRRSNRTLLIVTLVLVAGISTLFLVDLYSRHETAIEDTKRFALSFAEVLAEHTARTFEALDLTLRAADAVRRSTEPPVSNSIEAANKVLQNLQSNSPALLAIGWTDVKGDVQAHSYRGPSVRSNIADLPQFKTLQEADPQGMFVGALYRSKANNQWISAVSLRINDGQGNFAGIINAPLDLSYFSRTFRSVELGPDDSVALMRLDGTLLMREPYVESAAGKSFSQAPLFTKLILESQSGTSEAISMVDGHDRIYAYQRVPNLPLLILVTQNRADALAGWYRHIRTFGPLVLLLIGIIIVGAILLSRRTSQHLTQTALLEATLENMHEGLIVVDNTNRVAISNSRALDLLDLPAGLMNSRPTPQDVIAYQTASDEYEHTPADIKARLHPKLSGGTASVFERQRPNGTLLEIRTVPFAEGGVIRTFKDITEQRRMENEISRSERQFRILAEHATDIIARLDFKGRILYISPSCLHILGRAPAELVGAIVTDYIHPDDIAPTLEAFRQVVAGTVNADRKIEYRFHHRSGDWRWLEAHPTVVTNEAGDGRELVDVVRDITDRKRIEAEANAARKQAEQASIAKGEFLASMSHEVRTPLNSIIGFSDIVLDRGDIDPEVRRQVGLIQTASESLLSIVNDVLDFSRIEEGKLQIVPANFEMARFVDGTVALIKGAADAKRLDIQVSIDPAVPRDLIGDDQRLRQVLLNLLNNAVKFTHHGFVQLVVSRHEPLPAQQHIRFSISDTGVGIPASKQDRLFKRFSQVDGSISREFGGSGLGLAICKRLVELMGGEIGFDSCVAEGSTFWFSVPLPAADAGLARSETGARTDVDNRHKRILLVEDLEVNREIALAILGKQGYQVDAVSDGADAIASIKSKPYDLVLMDVQMPGMDGVTATKLVRALPPPAGAVPILAMTANVLPDQIEGFLKAGMNGHIGKPFKPAKLAAAIEAQIGRDMKNPSGPAAVATAENSAIDALQAMISPEQLDALFTMLVRRLEQFQAASGILDRDELREEAHKLTSSAGLLGFQEFSEHCARLETAIKDGRPIKNLYETARLGSVTVLGALQSRRAQSA